MKKSFEYDLTKYDPNAPTKTEEFLTADGVKILTTDANNGAVLIQDTVDGDSLNPVTAAAVATAIEQGGGGSSYEAGDGIAIADGEISAKVDGTTIDINSDGELEAIGGGGSSYTAGDGIKIENNVVSVNAGDGLTSGSFVCFANSDADTQADDWSYMGIKGSKVATVTNGACSIYFEQKPGTGELNASVVCSCAATSTAPDVMPYFYNASDHTKYVTCATTVPTAMVASTGYTNLFYIGSYNSSTGRYVISMSNLTLDTSHAGAGFAVADLATNDWCLAFHCTGGLAAGWDATPTPMGTYNINASMPLNKAGVWDNTVSVGVGNGLQVSSNAVSVKLATNQGLTVSSSGLGVNVDGTTIAVDPTWNSLYVTNPLPSTLGTAGQVLSVNSGATGVEWSALTTSVTDIQQVAALPASPVSSVLYLIPET